MAGRWGLFHCEIAACKGWDQAVFTRLVYMDLRKRAPVAVLSPEVGRALHLHSNLEVRISRAHEVLNEQGQAAAVVHAYDRFAVLTAIVTERFPYGGSNAGAQSSVFTHA